MVLIIIGALSQVFIFIAGIVFIVLWLLIPFIIISGLLLLLTR